MAKQFLGKKLCTKIGKIYTSRIFIETEAYTRIIDKASHAYMGKRSPRNEVVYHIVFSVKEECCKEKD